MKKKLSYAIVIAITVAEMWLCWEGYRMKKSIEKLERIYVIYESNRSGWQGAQVEP